MKSGEVGQVFLLIGLFAFILPTIESCHFVRVILQKGSVVGELNEPYSVKKSGTFRNKDAVLPFNDLSKKESKKKKCTCSSFDMSHRERPWIAMVRSEDPQKGHLSSCSATLISKTTFLTTASCICGLKKDLCPFDEGRSGAFMSKPIQKLSVRLPGKISHDDIAVAKIYVHANYTNSSPLNDVGLLQITQELDVNPICFPTPSLLKAKKVDPVNCHFVSNELKCNESPLYHYTGARNGIAVDQKACSSNGLGPRAFKKCMFDEEHKDCMSTNPLSSHVNSPNCKKYMEELNNATVVKDKFSISYEKDICINPDFKLTQRYGTYFSKVGRLNGWCYTCSEGNLKDCKEWGFCSPHCNFPKTDSEKSPFTIVEGVANSIRDEEKCGELHKSLCLMDSFFTGDNLILGRDSENKLQTELEHHFGQIRSVDAIKERIESSSGVQCKDLTGGAIWKLVRIGRKNIIRAPFLTGLLGKFENDCEDVKGKFLDVKHVDIQSYAGDILNVVQDLCTMSLKKKRKNDSQ